MEGDWPLGGVFPLMLLLPLPLPPPGDKLLLMWPVFGISICLMLWIELAEEPASDEFDVFTAPVRMTFGTAPVGGRISSCVKFQPSVELGVPDMTELDEAGEM